MKDDHLNALRTVAEAAREFHAATQHRLNLMSPSPAPTNSYDRIKALADALGDYRRTESDLLSALAALNPSDGGAGNG
jgi:hypothetical protein